MTITQMHNCLAEQGCSFRKVDDVYMLTNETHVFHTVDKAGITVLTMQKLKKLIKESKESENDSH